MADLLYAISGLYILMALFVWFGLRRRLPQPSGEPLRSASVIICARNEERDLPACLKSLDDQVIEPEFEPLEVILVDDDSQDRTPELMSAYKA